MPQVFDLWQDPQERYDIFMNNFTERTWMVVDHRRAIKKLMKTYVQVSAAQAAERRLHRPDHAVGLPEVPVRSRNSLAKEGVSMPMPTGN